MINLSLYRLRWLAGVSLLVWGGAAFAASDDMAHGISRKDPVLLTAEQVGYDSQTSTATAIGRVEVVQGETILLADRLVYNQNTDTIHASGHVSVLEPSGDVFFSDDAVLKDQLARGLVQQFKARLSDNSLFVAREADKQSKTRTVMRDAVYSPCSICSPKPGEPPSAPLWQVEAKKVVLDEETKRIYYHNAWMDVYGVPVLYTPYFRSPTPDAPSTTGLLQPQYFHASDLGSVFKEPVFLAIAPNMDATITPWVMSGEKPLLQAEFRHMIPEGSYIISGAVTDTYNRDDFGNIIPGDEVRGYIEAHGKLQVSKHWDVGIDAERTTDNTFLQLYGLNWQDLLTSRLYAERIQDRNYAVVESLAFQGLEAQDIGGQSPVILPQGNLHLETDPLALHSRLMLDANALELTRQQGQSDQRISSTASWKIPYITKNGQVFEAKATMRGDAYNVTDLTDPRTGMAESGSTGRAIPQLDVNWRYPFINRFGKGDSLTISPIVELTGSPNLHNNSLIPNEDSQVAELTDINLFSADRFSGLDQVESGFRGTYGMRGQLQFADLEYVDWLFGQAYQENQSSPFPLAVGNLNSHYSDYIGRVAFRYKWLDLTYRFRADRDTFNLTANEVDAHFNLQPVTFDINYIGLQNEPIYGNQKEIFGSLSLDLTPNWSWNISDRQDLGSPQLTALNPALPVSVLNPLESTNGAVGLGTHIIYHNECVQINTGISRNYISEQDVRPSTTVAVVVTLKNFGTPGAGSNPVSSTGNVADVNTGVTPGSTNEMQNPNNYNTWNTGTNVNNGTGRP